MAAIIRIKRSTGTSAPGSLKTGELAYSAGTGLYNNGGDRLFYGKGDDGNGNATSVVAIGGEYFANLADHAPGTLTASSAIVTDANSKIDVLNVDNITIDGNTVSSTDTNGNIVLDPNGSGIVNVSNSLVSNVTDPVSPQDAATKAYVDAQNDGQFFTINGDTGTDTVDLDDSDVTFTGDDWITTAVTDNTVTFTHDVSGVTAGTYGSQTEIPVFTVDDRGHLDSAGTVPLATVLNTGADTGTGDVALLDSSISFVGGTNIHTVASNNQIMIHMDSAVTGLSSLTIDNLSLDGNTISSTDTNGAINLTPNGTGEVVAATLTVSDLTDNRVVLAGTSGALEDDANFTFDGSNLNLTAGMNITGDLDVDNININGNDVTSTDANGNINITPNGTGEVVISTATVSDLTDNRVVIAGASGALEDDANFTFDGTTLTVTADQTLTGDVTLTGQLDVDNIRINGNTIYSTDGSNVLYIDPAPTDSDGGDLIIRGNLTVQGTQTIINSTTLSVNDKNIVLADSAADSAAADGAGITVEGANATITYDAATDRWDFNKGLAINGTDLDDAINIGGVAFTETLEDHFANNVFQGHDSSGQDITYDDGAGTITFSNQYASLTNVGTASFGGYTDSAGAPAPGNNRQFSVSAKGDVTIVELDGGTY